MRVIYLMFTVALIISFIGGCSEVLEKGTITGRVTNEDVGVAGAFVMLLEEGELLAGNAPLSNANVTGSDGYYRIYYVEPNHNYYVCAVKDNDNDLTYTPGTDQIGYYGDYQGFAWIPTPVSVAPGETLNDINIRRML